MMELARALSHGECSPTYSVILVAFDLEEYGSQGSLVFVQEFLIPTVLRAGGYPEFRGAIIMDSILYHNNTEHSQTMEEQWAEQVPGAFRDIKEHHGKGKKPDKTVIKNEYFRAGRLPSSYAKIIARR